MSTCKRHRFPPDIIGTVLGINPLGIGSDDGQVVRRIPSAFVLRLVQRFFDGSELTGQRR